MALVVPPGAAFAHAPPLEEALARALPYAIVADADALPRGLQRMGASRAAPHRRPAVAGDQAQGDEQRPRGRGAPVHRFIIAKNPAGAQPRTMLDSRPVHHIALVVQDLQRA